jgi:acyl-CoA synthetase (AMP-forming)/AMP-acid ligase II
VYAHLCDLLRARSEHYPTAIAVGGQEGLVWKTLASRELLELVDRLADELAAEGVGQGDRMVLWVPNHWRTPICLFAIWCAARM